MLSNISLNPKVRFRLFFNVAPVPLVALFTAAPLITVCWASLHYCFHICWSLCCFPSVPICSSDHCLLFPLPLFSLAPVIIVFTYSIDQFSDAALIIVCCCPVDCCMLLFSPDYCMLLLLPWSLCSCSLHDSWHNPLDDIQWCFLDVYFHCSHDEYFYCSLHNCLLLIPFIIT